jgi:hypothetical protein
MHSVKISAPAEYERRGGEKTMTMRGVLVAQLILSLLAAALSLYRGEMLLLGFGLGVAGAAVGAWLAEELQ